jgi:hypothetical protein
LQASKINNENYLVISSDRYRSQQQNKEDCTSKLYDMLVLAGALPEGTSEAQKLRVIQLYVSIVFMVSLIQYKRKQY